jgi:hypothetical protein
MVVARGSLAAYEEPAGAEAIEAVRAAAGPVRGARVLHVSGAHGGRVPELLSAMLPLAVDAGLEVEWRVLFGGPDLQDVVAERRDDARAELLPAREHGTETREEDVALLALRRREVRGQTAAEHEHPVGTRKRHADFRHRG